MHRAGGRIFLQLAHGGRISHPSLQPNGELPVAPSALRPQGRVYTPEGPKPFEAPRELTRQELPRIVDEFAAATLAARAAGFDGVELHAANGYLLDQFLRDGSNHRDDEYGDTPENRARLLVEVAQAAAAAWAPGSVGVRISPFNPYNDMSDSDPIATFSVVARALAPLSLAYLHVMEPVGAGKPAEFTGRLRELFRGPVIANGGYDAEHAAAALAAQRVDAVSFGVPFLANPDLPERLALSLPLNAPDTSTFYGGGARGYVDYARHSAAA